VNIHQLANLLEHLRDGLGPALVKSAAADIGDAAAALRGLPDKSIKDLVTDLNKVTGAGPEKIVERIRDCPGDTKAVEAILKEVRKLKKPELEALLGAFGKPFKGRTVPLMKSDVEALVRGGRAASLPPVATTSSAEAVTGQDAEAVERGVRLFQGLRDSASLTIDDIRCQFAPLHREPRQVLRQVASRVGFDFDGTREEIAVRLQEVLERLKVSQVKGEIIRTPTGPT
jgi:hypothetical protein